MNTERDRLPNIMSKYAEIWADVLYDRNLEVHIAEINRDIALVRLLIIAKRSNAPSTALSRIRQDLERLARVISRKKKRLLHN